MALKTDYKNDILDIDKNLNRKYEMTTNDDGTVSFTDKTVYSQTGDDFGATELNATNKEINSDINAINTEIDTINNNLQSEIDTINNNLSDLYPIGAVVMGATDDFSTEAKIIARYGGSAWTNISDRVLLGASSTKAVGTTGGSNDAIVVSHTHTGPSHTHTWSGTTSSSGSHTHTLNGLASCSYSALNVDCQPTSYSGRYSATSGLINSAGEHTHTISGTTGSSGTGNTGSTGSSGTNANIPAYFSVYMWVRTA